VAQLSIEEITDIETFSSLRERWDTLLQKSGDNNVFLTWEWLFMWWRHFGEDKQLRILLIKERDDVIGIVPLMQWQYKKGPFHVNVLENICAQECDYSGVILTEKQDECAVVLLDYLGKLVKEENLVIRVSHIPDNADFLITLRNQYPSFSGSLSINERLISSCPYIDLPATWDEYYDNLHKNGRKKAKRIKREMQAMQENNELQFKKHTQGDNIQDQLQILFRLHQKRWKERNISSKFSIPEVREFYEDVSEAFIENNWMDLSFLYIDGNVVSAGWGFRYFNQFYYMTSTFDPEHSNHNLGHIHTLQLIEEAIDNGLSRFDFLKGDEFFKTYWAHSKNNNVQIMVSSKGFKGKCRVKLLEMFSKIIRIQERSFGDNMKLLLKNMRVQDNYRFSFKGEKRT